MTIGNVLKLRMSSSTASSSVGDNCSPCIIQRDTLLKMNRLSQEIEHLDEQVRASQLISPTDSVLKGIQHELGQNRRKSMTISTAQVQLLHKMERQQYSSLHRLLSLNPKKRVEKLKRQLSCKLEEAAETELMREQLERQSVRLSEMCESEFISSTDSKLMETKTRLEEERQVLVASIVRSLPSGSEYKQIQHEVDANNALILSCQSIKEQIQAVNDTYREAYSLIREALAFMVDLAYQSDVAAFVTGPYALAVEAQRFISLACMMIQPDAQRRYADFATKLVHTRVGKFPSVFKALAQPGALSKPMPLSRMDLQEKLERAEHMLVQMHQKTVSNIIVLDQWTDKIDAELLLVQGRKQHLSRQLEDCAHRLVASASVAP